MRDDYILVVEDNPDVAEVVLLALQAAGYEARAVANGAEAMELIRQRPPALILLDMLMPVMDGVHFAREYHTRYAHSTPIIVVTAAEHAEDRAADIEAEGVLAKPFDVDELLRVVERFHPSAHEVHASW